MRRTLMLVFVVATGCTGSDDDLCTRAALHLEACSGKTLEQLPDTCDPQHARRLLEASCEELAAAARSSSFNLGDFFGDLWEEAFGPCSWRWGDCYVEDGDCWLPEGTWIEGRFCREGRWGA